MNNDSHESSKIVMIVVNGVARSLGAVPPTFRDETPVGQGFICSKAIDVLIMDANSGNDQEI